MVDRISKAVAKLSGPEQKRVWEVFDAILSGEIAGLDVKKIKNENNVFRVRCGQIRVVYKRENKKILFISVGRRNEKTYRDF